MKLIYLILVLFVPLIASSQQVKYTEIEAFELIKKVEPTPFERTIHPEAQWFPEAGLGLFIHWGIHSVAALNPSWVMIKNCPWAIGREVVSVEDYYRLAKEFDPSSYDPEKWILAVKSAGFQYVILTTKHHDGYCLWPSNYGKWNTGNYMGGRDLLKPYVDACRKYGLKVGFYFSPRDWGNPEYKMPYVDFDYTERTSAEDVDNEGDQKRFNEFFETTIGQLSELLTRYGKIDVLWFDGLSWDGVDTHSEKLHTWLRTIQPGMVINPRWSPNDEAKSFGDYKTEEIEWGNNPEERPEEVNVGEWWEFCNSWTGHWGYSPLKPFKGIEEIMKVLVYARSYSGNYLLNVGPAPDGTMRPGYYEECLQLSKWMERNKVSVIGCQGVNNWEDISNVPLTKKGQTYYAHVLGDHQGPVTIQMKEKPGKITLLKNGKTLSYEYNKKEGITISLVDSDRERINDVVKISF